MRPTGMTISRRDAASNMYSVVFENARGQVSVEASPAMLMRWCTEIIERVERDEDARTR